MKAKLSEEIGGLSIKSRVLRFLQCQTLRAPPRRGRHLAFFVYAIKSLENERIYIGHTNDPNTRLDYHNAGYVKSTAKHRPWVLVGLEEVATKSQAMWVEGALKRSRGRRMKWLSENRKDG